MLERTTTAIAIALVAALNTASPARGEGRVSYNRDVRPILSSTCFACHGPDATHRKAGLRLDTPDGATLALESGARAIVPGEPSRSALIARIDHTDPAERMPPVESHKTLTEAQRRTLRDWIAQGAVYERHWSFITPRRPDLPRVKRDDWPRNPIDRFVLARLEVEGLSPSPQADRATLARRLHLDLTGLPPTPAEVDAFVNDAAPGAYERLVDRLLGSPHYGERMAMPWLDAARYADTNGFSIDEHRDMWAWRDWVINACNRNTPYDQFIVEQLAGDLLPNATVEQRVATGFLRNSMSTHEGGTLPQEYRVIYLADKVDTVATVMLGLTMRCAQCHEHKYDPVTQEEYYRFYAYFDRAIEPGHGANNANTPPMIDVKPLIGDVATMKQRLERRLQRLRDWRDRLADKATHDDADVVAIFGDQFVSNGTARKTVEREIGVLEKTVKAGKVSVMVMQEQPKPGPTYLLQRGAYDQPDKSKPLAPGTPAALPPMPADAPPNRLGLARWLTHPDHPLTARVAVNRHWQMLFGRGLVATPNDFGAQGRMPSHPALLDWLARQYIDSGWDTKRLIKTIVMSATYRQSSAASPELFARDPDNRLLARGARFRMPAEMVRDNALAVAGLLVRYLGGPSVFPVQPPGLWREVSHYGYPNPFTSHVYIPDTGDDLRRRSMYACWKRTSPPPAMSALDAPTREVCTVERSRTNTPLQALVLLNDPQFVDAARALAAMTMRRDTADNHDRLAFAFRRATLRDPSPRERSILMQRLTDARARYRDDADAAAALVKPVTYAPDGSDALDPAEHAAWTDVCNVILNLDETITKE